MLGTGKVKLISHEKDPYEIMFETYRIKDNNVFVAKQNTNQLFHRAGANRRGMPPGAAEEYIKREDILEHINNDIAKPYIIQICNVITNITSPIKRKCVVGFFMANGTTLRYPDEFKLDINTEDQTTNIENEEINKLIDDFREELYNKLSNASDKFNAYIENRFPLKIRDELFSKAGDYWITSTTGNFNKSFSKLLNEYDGSNWTDEDKVNFSDVLQPYRTIAKMIKDPSLEKMSGLVCEKIGVDKSTMLKYARDAIGPIIAITPNKIVKDIVNA